MATTQIVIDKDVDEALGQLAAKLNLNLKDTIRLLVDHSDRVLSTCCEEEDEDDDDLEGLDNFDDDDFLDEEDDYDEDDYDDEDEDEDDEEGWS